MQKILLLNKRISLLLLVFFGALGIAWGQTTYTVTSSSEFGGTNTLRGAISAMTAAGGTIFISANIGTITLSTPITITQPMTIEGPREGFVTVSGNNATNIFDINTAGKVTLNRLVIADGKKTVPTDGIGVFVHTGGGDFEMNDCTIKSNNATVTGNAGGAGVNILLSNASFNRCTFEGNTIIATGSGKGGALYFDGTGKNLSIINCTFTGSNVGTGAGNNGGAIYVGTANGVTLQHNTIYNNAANLGSGLFVAAATNVQINGNIIINNALLDEVRVTATGGTYNDNIFGANTFSGIFSTSNNVNTVHNSTSTYLDPTLKDHGGYTQTFLPLANAIDKITAGTYPSITTDQRGVKRVGDTDIGAHEFRKDVVTLNTYTGTSVYGELGYAISNATAFTTIGFNLLGRYSEIKPAVALPVISQSVYVDGYSQPYFLTADFVTAFSKNTASVGISTNAQLGVSINGENLPAFTTVLEFTNASNTVEGLAIHSALYGSGITLNGTNNTVKGCYIGILPYKTNVPAKRLMYGIKINSSNNTIGGINAEDRNIISNSINPSSIGGINIGIYGSGNYVVNNYLGTDRTGIIPIPNSINGIYLANGANNNVIGGNTSSLRNVIAGNTVGLYISSNNNSVKGNYIGIGADGFTTIPNGNGGVAINNGSHNIIGTTSANEGNLIVGNTNSGVTVLSGINNAIRGNSIFGNIGSLVTSAGIKLNSGNNLKQPAQFIGVSGSFLTVYSTSIGDNIDLYLDDPAGTVVAQGKTFVQTQTATDNIVNFTTAAASFTAGTEKLTLTATDATNGTSFFTALYTAPSINIISVGSTSAFLTAGTTNNLLYGLKITCNTGASSNGAFFQGVSLNTTGTPTFITSDFDNIKVYYSNTNVFSTANFMTVADINTILTFKTAGLFIPQGESKYLWFTGDVSASAVLGHKISSIYGNSIFPYASSISSTGATASSLQTIVADNFTVFNTNELPITGSLAWAINNANANALDFNTISFRIPTTDVNHVGTAPDDYWTIPMTSSTLDITSPIFISGYSQTGASPNTLPILNGNNAVLKIQITGDGTNPTIRLSTGNGGSIIQGLILNGNLAGNGAIEVNSPDCKIQGCFIGTDAFGSTEAVAKNVIGINLQTNATNATIGGTNLADRNVIAGNTGRGVNNLGANGVKVINNYFNLAKNGITPITGSSIGTVCLFGGSNAQIGNSTTVEQANIIAGVPNSKGVFTNSATNNNLIDGNWIGLNITGEVIAGLTGIDLSGTVGNHTISNNYIAEQDNGIGISSPSNTIQFNQIGLNYSGISAPNFYGIGISNGGDNNTIKNNTIATNTRGIYAPLGTNNWFFSNYIYGNTQIGIDLANSATILPNDDSDGDLGGGNQQQNYPDNIVAKLSGNNNLAVSFSIFSGLTDSAYPLSVQFFKSDGNNQGKNYLGFASAVYSTPNANYTHTFVAQNLAVGDKITTLVTDANGNTSEFSPDVTVLLACVQPTITAVNISQNATCTQVLSTDLTVSVSNAGSFSTLYDIDYNGDEIYDIFSVSLVNSQLVVKNAPILGQIIRNPKIKLTSQNAGECASNPFAFNALVSPQTQSGPRISSISVVDPTTCPKPNGKVILTFEGTIPENLVFNVDLDGNGIYEIQGIKTNTQNQLVIENLSGGTQIGTSINTFLLGNECISTLTLTNKRTLALANIQDDIRVRAELAQISPNFATNIIVSNAQVALKYNLLDKDSQFISTGQTLENGGTIIFPTGFLQQTTRYLVQAEASNCQKTIVGQTEVEVIEGIGQEDLNILKDIFGKTGGNNYWTTKWDFSQNKQFFGVSFFAGRVTAISLRKNNLIDRFPQSVLQLPKLVALDVAENKLTFESFEELIPKFLPSVSVVYNLQDKFETAYIQDVAEGEVMFLTATTAGKDNKYQWLKDGVNIPNATESALKIDVSKLTDEGEYTCYVTNKAAPNLTLIRHTIKVNVFEQVTDEDLAELKAFHDAFKGTNWINRWDFKDKKRVFAWHGIRMKGRKVIDLSLPNNNLDGQLNEDMFKKQNGIFSELEHLNLSGNNLSGEIPVNLMTLQKLTYLDLSNNQFKGTISGNLARSASLKTLILSHNQFSAVHSDFGKIIGLRTLFLNNNNFTTIPSQIYSLTTLEVLNLNENSIFSISTNISQLKLLNYLGLSDNFLTQLPSQLVLLNNLNELNITNNRIKDLPKGLEKLEKLAILKISGNYFEFDDILPFVFDGGGKSLAQVTYSPQRKIGKEKVIVALTDSKLDLFSESLAKGNVFEWYKNNKKINSVNVVGEKLSIFPVRLTDAGLYSVVVTNPNAPQLTLNSYDITVLTNCNSQIQNAKILVKGNTIFCEGEKVYAQLNVSIPNANLYNLQWLQNGKKIEGARGNEFTVSEVGTYNIILTDKQNCSVLLNEVAIQNYPKPKLAISAQSNVLKIESISDENGARQWLWNGQPIAGATGTIWEARQQGNYALQITTDKGCVSVSEKIVINATNLEDNHLPSELKIYPNPNQGRFTVELTENNLKSLHIQIFNTEGQKVLDKIYDKLNAYYLEKMDISDLPSGVYVIQISTNNGNHQRKITKD